MRSLHALLRALRTRRKHPETDPVAANDHPGLADLLEAARAPGTPEELAGEKEVVAAFVAHRRRAARSDRRHRTRARIRAVLVPATTGLALLVLAGTAVAARTGNLPQDAQQHAHRLFSALGVPAPRTGTPTPDRSSRPHPRPSLDVTALTWCRAWGASDSPLSREDRRKLSDRAGGEDSIDKYCRELHRSASAAPQPPPAASTSPSPTPSPSLSPPSASSPGELPPSLDPAPSTTRDHGRPSQPGRAPTAPPSSKPAKPTHTGKPSGGPPSKSKGPKNAEKHRTASPSVPAPTSDGADSRFPS